MFRVLGWFPLLFGLTGFGVVYACALWGFVLLFACSLCGFLRGFCDSRCSLFVMVSWCTWGCYCSCLGCFLHGVFPEDSSFSLRFCVGGGCLAFVKLVGRVGVPLFLLGLRVMWLVNLLVGLT